MWPVKKILVFFKPFLPPANEVWGKVMFSEVSVILSTGEGVCPSPPDADPPLDADTPRGILRDMVNKRVVRILLECILIIVNIIANIPEKILTFCVTSFHHFCVVNSGFMGRGISP